MQVEFYQEYNVRDEKEKRCLALVVDGKTAYYINKTKVEHLWLSTLQSCIKENTLRKITKVEAIQEVPELESFLQQLPTLPKVFLELSLKPLTHGG